MLGTVGVASALFNHAQPTAPLMITFLRLGFSALFLLPLAWVTSGVNPLKTTRRNLPLFGAMGLAMAACQSLFFLAIPISTVTLVVVISLCSAPVIVAILSIVLFKERITLKVAVSIILAITGTVGLVLGGGSGGSELFRLDYLWGAGLALASGFAYSSFMLLSKVATRQTSSSSLQTVALAFTVGTLMLLPLVLVSGSWQINLNWQAWLIAIYMGLVPTGLAYFFIQLALTRTSATSAAIVTLLEPAVAALLAWLLLGENITLLTLVGMGLLVVSVILLSQGATPFVRKQR
jgi:DME family drug/metabolite transporter